MGNRHWTTAAVANGAWRRAIGRVLARRKVAGYGTVKLWDTHTRREIVTLDGHGDPIFALAFSPDGERLASGCSDGKARIWQVDSLASRSDPGSRRGPT
ncbi:MAG: hypothetical protein HY000_33855 [Planctomycetes bacterium]|nr:hypothetical protein [Planctomycetota bacterium]